MEVNNSTKLFAYSTAFDELEKLGEGSFGKVYKVRDKQDGNKYAVKKINFEGPTIDKETQREVDNLIKTQSEFVVKYKLSWIEMNTFYIQLELCDNNLWNVINIKKQTFDRYLNQAMNPIEYYISCEMVKEILQCVNYLHQLVPQVIHRDLNPGNILIKYNESTKRYFKLCDFGLSVLHTQSMSHSINQGTIKYIAPEVQKSKKYDSKADVYSLSKIIEDLFDIDINNEGNSSMYNPNSPIKTLFENMLEQLCKMQISPNYTGRPTCAEVLANQQNWALDKQIVRQHVEFKSTLKKLEQNENIFFYHFLNTKLNSSS